jgi:hypothetical protein
MAAKKGDYLGGIRCVEHLRERSYVDPDTGCWHWRMGTSCGAPKVWLQIDGKKIGTRGRRAALMLLGQIQPGQTAFAKTCCKSDDCVNPEHSRAGTRGQHGEWITNSARYAGLVSRKLGAVKARATRPTKLTMTKAREIRASSETQKALALRYGVSQSVVSAIKLGRIWAEPTWIPIKEAA